MVSPSPGHSISHSVVVLLLSTCLGTYSHVLKVNVDTSADGYTGRPEVEIPQGRLRGLNMVAHGGRSFFAFKGIPFAQPPVGNLRFKEPSPAGTWTGILDAGVDANQCPQGQLFRDGVKGDEDCLYLNVYTPRLPTGNDSELLSVMVFIHGGGFQYGHISPEKFGPQFILKKDVVLVLPNYRLGLLGFLSTGDDVAPGNFGLKDMVQALKWNRDNIRYFGGDPDRVTIFGESAGAISVHLLTLSNLSNGLFHKFITESGSALGFDGGRPRTVLASNTIRLGEHFGCPTNTSTALIDCLRDCNASQLIKTDSLFNVWKNFPSVVWGPTVEVHSEGAFLTESPAALFAAGKSAHLPWIYCVNRDEGLIFSSKFYTQQDLLPDLLNQMDTALPAMLGYDGSVDDVQAYTNALKSYFLNDPTANRSLLLKNLTQMIGDSLFAYPTYRASELHLLHAKTPQYFCSFEYRGTFSASYTYSDGSLDDYGVAHSDDTIYLFKKPYEQLGNAGSEFNKGDWKMVETMVQLLTSFAITGTPSTEGLNTTAIWEPYSSRKNYLRIGNHSDPSISVGHNYLEDRMQFWEKLTAATSWK